MLKRVIAIALIILLAGCTPTNGIVLTEEELFVNLERDFPGREFEILRIFGPSWGPGIDSVSHRHFTLRCLHTGIEFRTIGVDNSVYTRALWTRLTGNWQREFENSFNAIMRDLRTAHSSLNFAIDVENFDFIANANIAEQNLEEILQAFVELGEPVFIRLSVSYRQDIFEFEQQRATEDIEMILNQFVTPIYNRIYAVVGSDFHINFSYSAHYRVIHRDRSTPGWLDDIRFRMQKDCAEDLRGLLVGLYDYDFAVYFTK